VIAAIATAGLLSALLAAGPPPRDPAGATTPPPAVPVAERGLAVGDKAPPFRGKDQSGRIQTFADLTGPRGLVLLFVRSADW